MSGENQMADFGNVQNLPFAFFPDITHYNYFFVHYLCYYILEN